MRRLLLACWPLLVVSAAHLLVLVLVPPLHEVPQNDDWAYYLTLQEWMATGTLPHLGWNDPTLVGQILWGRLFAELFGLSYTSLRASTLLLAWLGSLAFYGVLRRCGLSRAVGVAGALLLLFDPIVLVASHSFNTDVPYLSLATIATWLLLRALDTGSVRDVAAAGVVAAASHLVRQQGLLLAVTAAAWIAAVGWRGRPRRLAAVAALLVPVAIAVVAHAAWLRGATGSWWPHWSSLEGSPVAGGAAAIASRIAWITVESAKLLLTAGVLLAPAAIAVVFAGGKSWCLASVVLAGASLMLPSIQSAALQGWPYTGNYVTRSGPLPFPPGDAWGPAWIWIAATALALPCAAALLVAALRVGMAAWRAPLAAGKPALVVALGLAQLAPTLLLAELYDRYLLVVLPAAIVAASTMVVAAPAALRIGAVALAVFAPLSVEWLRAHVDRSRARFEVADELVASGFAPAQIGAGFEWEGAHLYLRALRELGARPPFQLQVCYPWAPLLDVRVQLLDVDRVPGPTFVARPYRPFLGTGERFVVGERDRRKR